MVDAPAERANILPLFLLYPYMHSASNPSSPSPSLPSSTLKKLISKIKRTEKDIHYRNTDPTIRVKLLRITCKNRYFNRYRAAANRNLAQLYRNCNWLPVFHRLEVKVPVFRKETLMPILQGTRVLTMYCRFSKSLYFMKYYTIINHLESQTMSPYIGVFNLLIFLHLIYNLPAKLTLYPISPALFKRPTPP
jgi:hypothetical protein